MTLKEKSLIERMLGIIEGAASVLDDKVAMPILTAIETIDNILEKEKGGSE